MNRKKITPEQPAVGRYASYLLKDRWFKRMLGSEQSKPLLALLLKELIPEREIAQLTLRSQEHVNDEDENKDIRVDIECTDKDGTRFMVEMQLAPQKGFYERAIFNVSFGIQEQLSRGSVSYDFPTVYFIGFMNFSFHKGSSKVLYRYTLQERDSHELMSERLQFLFLELPNCEQVAKESATEIDRLSDALRNMHTWSAPPEGYDSKLLDLLLKSAEIATFAPELRKKYIHDMTTERDIINQIDYARQEGMAAGVLASAKAMLEHGMSPDEVKVILKLSDEELAPLL